MPHRKKWRYDIQIGFRRLVAHIMKIGTQQLDAECFAKFVPMIVDTKYHERPGAVERINAVYRRKLKHVRFSNPDALDLSQLFFSFFLNATSNIP